MDMRTGFAGDVVLGLAKAGVLVLEAEVADPLIVDLENALDVARVRAFGAELATSSSWAEISTRFPEFERLAVDAAFTEQVWPGQTELALRELPKYIEALQLAKRA